MHYDPTQAVFSKHVFLCTLLSAGQPSWSAVVSPPQALWKCGSQYQYANRQINAVEQIFV